MSSACGASSSRMPGKLPPRIRLLAMVPLLAACHGSRGFDWAAVAEKREGSTEVKVPVLVPDSELKAFLPERVGGRLGEFPQGTMTRMGDRALSEATRNYRGGPPSETGQVQIKIADAWLEPRATQAIRSLAELHDNLGERAEERAASPERLIVPDGIGYARFDQGSGMAQAQVLIAGRFIASATVAQAADAQEAAEALRALDTQGLARLARPQ
jgi:hypothetical protein